MAKGISISMAADTRSFITGVQKGVIEPLDDAAEIIEDLGKDGARDFDRLESSMRDAQRETDDTRKKFSDLQKEIRETGRKSRTDFANPMKKSTDSVKDNLDEVRSEAKQNAAEMFSSFDGSFESIADAAQGTLGGLTAGLGGIPAMAAAAAGAAGIGLIAAEISKQQDLAKELSEGLKNAYAEAAEAGRDYLDEAQIIARANEIIFDPDRFKKAQKDAKTLGVDVSTAIRAQAGDLEALNTISQIAAQSEEERQRLASLPRQNSAAAQEAAALGRAVEKYAELEQEMKDNAELARTAGTVKAEVERAQRDQIQRTRDTESERWSEAGRLYDEAAKRGPITVRTEIQQPDTETLRRSIENNFRRRPARVQADVVDRAGRNVR